MITQVFLNQQHLEEEIQPDDVIIISSAEEGEVYIRPTEENVQRFEAYVQDQEKDDKRRIQTPVRTTDNIGFHVYAAISDFDEAQEALDRGAEGLGLPRTELLYQKHTKLPYFIEEEMTAEYTKIAKAYQGKLCQWRLMDLSQDKGLPVAKQRLVTQLSREDRLGRGMENLLEEFFYGPQARALLRASIYHEAPRIYFPFVDSGKSFRDRKELVNVQAGILRHNRIPHKSNITMGAMIESAKGVDNLRSILEAGAKFICIGSNDLLASYTARGRERGGNPADPGVLKLIHKVISEINAINEETEVSVCGNLAKPAYLPLLIGMGIRRISTPKQCFGHTEDVVQNFTLDECQNLFAEATQHESDEAVRQLLKTKYHEKGLRVMW